MTENTPGSSGSPVGKLYSPRISTLVTRGLSSSLAASVGANAERVVDLFYTLSEQLDPAIDWVVADLGDAGITVNVLAPGYHATDRLAEILDDDGRAAITAAIPLRRLGDPADFAAVAAFLASEQAGYITGAVVPIDGGDTRGLL